MQYNFDALSSEDNSVPDLTNLLTGILKNSDMEADARDDYLRVKYEIEKRKQKHPQKQVGTVSQKN